MNKLSVALAAVLGFALLAPVSAEAGGCRTRITYVGGACLNWEYQCVGRAYDGCPIYRWVVVSRSYPRCDYGYYGGRCDIHISGGYRGGYRGGYGHGGYHHRH
jgi:hypothetical protein